jgi:hypothetical protein
VLIGQAKNARVPLAICERRRLEHDSAAAHVDDSERMRVAMRIDTDHVVQLVCKHPYRPPARWGIDSGVGLGVKPQAARL